MGSIVGIEAVVNRNKIYQVTGTVELYDVVCADPNNNDRLI